MFMIGTSIHFERAKRDSQVSVGMLERLRVNVLSIFRNMAFVFFE